MHVWPKVHNLSPLLYTKHVPTINVTQDVHEKRVEGELRAGPHLTQWDGGVECNAALSLKMEKIDDRWAHSSVVYN